MGHATGKVVVLTEASKGICALMVRLLAAAVAVGDAIRHRLAADVVRDFHHDIVRAKWHLVSSGSGRTSGLNNGVDGSQLRRKQRRAIARHRARMLRKVSGSDSYLTVSDATSESHQ